MRAIRVGIGCALLLVASAVAGAQGRKPGLWEMTSTMTWQKLPFPPGMTPPPGVADRFNATPRTTQVCLTQAIIDKYGAPVPQTRAECRLTNVQKSDHGMTADMECIGRMTGKGAMHSSWDDPEHAKGGVHFNGTMQGQNGSLPIEWTTESTSVFKGTDCGDVKPLPVPEN
jgi:hypothetical protein